mmetsp:Transcript_1045/g.2238  ORF Transcript_1045/g.2238 Transcript_1045/m.2238 type:complete len:291 (-) Transcript_1045:515-1387(-)
MSGGALVSSRIPAFAACSTLLNRRPLKTACSIRAACNSAWLHRGVHNSRACVLLSAALSSRCTLRTQNTGKAGTSNRTLTWPAWSALGLCDCDSELTLSLVSPKEPSSTISSRWAYRVRQCSSSWKLRKPQWSGTSISSRIRICSLRGIKMQLPVRRRIWKPSGKATRRRRTINKSELILPKPLGSNRSHSSLYWLMTSSGTTRSSLPACPKKFSKMTAMTKLRSTKPPTKVKLTKKMIAAGADPQVSFAAEHRPDSSLTMQSCMRPFHDSPVTDRNSKRMALGSVRKLA